MYQSKLFFENKVIKKGFGVIAGADEVGRGSLSGPVVAGCVIFNKKQLAVISADMVGRNNEIPLINDSKKLSEKQRILADSWIRKNALSYGFGKASVNEVNKRGIVKAAHSAFRRAVSIAQRTNNIRVEYLLIDAFYIPNIKGLPIPKNRPYLVNKINKQQNTQAIDGRQMAIIKGDEKSFTIACASIIAKVYRDKLMQRLAKNLKYKKYEWEKNKGYGTKDHINAIKKYGITNLHRKLFVRKIQI